MAHNILAIPISTVASKSSFNVSSKVTEPHRASLSTDIVQMLLCGSDWVRELYGIKKKSQTPISCIMIMLFYLFPTSFLLIISSY
jgi:hypothetical protein